LNNSERVLRVFRKQPVDKIVWQPRLELWYDVNKFCGTLPDRYRDKDMLEICDDLGTSPRTYFLFNRTIKCIEGRDVKLETKEDSQNVVTIYSTPKGELREVKKKTQHGLATDGVTPYPTEYFLKGIEDFEVMKYILGNQTFEFDRQLYEKLNMMIGDRAAPIVSIPFSPLPKITAWWMGFEKTSITILKHEREVENFLRTLEENDDKRIDVIKRSPIPIVNFDDSIDENLYPRPLFSKYILPYYQEKSHELRAAGKFCTAHWDGKIKSLLQYAKESGLNGLEALTPKPQGNVTLEEIHSAFDGMIVTDGIPAISFLPWASDRELEEFTHKILKMFSPNLILGVGDIVPPNADIEKVRLVTKIVEKFQPQ
jgi:hypothetical protein